MLEAIVSTLMIIIGFCVFIQKSTARKRVAFYFAFAIASHASYFAYVSSNLDAYYISAGVLDLIVILLISCMKEAPRLAGDIQDISLISIMFNGVGWLLFNGGYSPAGYIAMFIALYGWAVFALFKGEPINDGSFKIDTRLYSFRDHACFRNTLNSKKQESK